MKTLLKLILSLIVLVIIAALAAPHFISADTIKAQLIEKIEASTGRKLKIEGELSLSFFPIAGVSAQQVSLSNPQGFSQSEDFIRLKELQVKLAIMPLLSRNVVIDSFVLDEPKINLHVNKAGAKNWEFSGKPAAAEAGAVPEAKSSSPSPALALAENIRLSNVALKNGSVVYTDDGAKTASELNDVNVKLSLGGVDSPLNVDGNALWNDKKIDVKAKLSTLKTLLTHARTDVDVNVSSDMISLAADGAVENNIFSGKANIKSGSLKNVASWLNPKAKPMATPATLALNAEGELHCGAAACEINKLALLIDKLEAKGHLKLVMADKPNIEVDLTTDALDFNPFMAPEKHAENVILISDAVADAGHWSTDNIDASALRSINLNAAIKAGSIKFHNITLGKSLLNAKIHNGRLDAVIPSMDLYSGNGSFSVAVDSAVAPMTIESRAVLKGIELEPLAKDAADLSQITGKADVDFNIASRGQSQQVIVSELGGNGKIKLSDGTIKHVNLLDMLHNIPGTGAKNGDVTSFSNMSGSFVITRGVLTNQDLLMQLTGLTVNGKGDVNLPAYTINYRLTPQVSGRGQDGKEKGGIAVPVIIQGSLDSPSFKPDVASLIQNALKDPAALKDQLHNTQRSFKDQLKSGNVARSVKDLKGLLKGF